MIRIGTTEIHEDGTVTCPDPPKVCCFRVDEETGEIEVNFRDDDL